MRIISIGLIAVVFALLTTCSNKGGNGAGETDTDSDTNSDTGEDTDTETDVDTEYACGSQPSLPECQETAPAPSDLEDVAQFVADNAISLECHEGGEWQLELDILVDEFADKQIFMTGEIHGTNEIGQLSQEILKRFVREGLVDIAALEAPMDASDAYNEYVTTGSMTGLMAYGIPYMNEYDLWRALPEAARDLFLEGYEVLVAPIDTPWRLAWVNEELEEIAATLSEDAAGLIVDQLPPPEDWPYYIDEAHMDLIFDYVEHVETNLDDICLDLDELNCDHVLYLAKALELATYRFYSEEYYNEQWWMTQRENLIYHNYCYLLASGEERIYAHMGAYHTGKYFDSVGGMLSILHPDLGGKVYTTTYGAGPDSEIWYGGEIMPASDYPEVASEPLADKPSDRFFISAVDPGHGCVDNPFVSTYLEYGFPLGEMYDAILWFDQLTPSLMKSTPPWNTDADLILRAQARYREMMGLVN